MGKTLKVKKPSNHEYKIEYLEKQVKKLKQARQTKILELLAHCKGKR